MSILPILLLATISVSQEPAAQGWAPPAGSAWPEDGPVLGTLPLALAQPAAARAGVRAALLPWALGQAGSTRQASPSS